MNKKIKKEFKYLFIAFITIGFVFLAVNFLIHPISFITHGVHKSNFILYSNWEQKNSIEVNTISSYCNLPGASTETKVECVVNHFGKIYNYTKYTKEYPSILKSDSITTEGYICRDIAVFYDAVFKKMDFYTDYVIVPNHIYNVIKEKNNSISCVINMDKYNCW